MEIFFFSKQEVRCNSQWFGNVTPFDPQTRFSWSGHDFLHTHAVLLSTTTHSWPAWHKTLIQGSKNSLTVKLCRLKGIFSVSFLNFSYINCILTSCNIHIFSSNNLRQVFGRQFRRHVWFAEMFSTYNQPTPYIYCRYLPVGVEVYCKFQ